MTTTTDGTKEEWLRRCAQRYIDKSGISQDEAQEWAEVCWENRLDDDELPEDAADNDMSYWEQS